MEAIPHYYQTYKTEALTYALELFMLIVAFSIAVWAACHIKKHLTAHHKTLKPSNKTLPIYIAVSSTPFLKPLFVLLGIQIAFFVYATLGYTPLLLPAAAQLTLSWVLIQIVRILTQGKVAAWLIIGAILPMTILNILGLWLPLLAFLDTLALSVGGAKVSIYKVLEVIFITTILFWSVSKITAFIEQHLKSSRALGVANRALVTKLLQIALYILAFFLTLDVIGIDLTALAVFSGALGVGLGFGLQKITSNFISGLILLFEKSVKATDMIEMVDGTFGIIKKITARYTLVRTYDGKEVMIPNEDFITQQVINWTHSDAKGRREVIIGVSYQSDLKKAQQLIFEAIHEHPDTLNDAPNQCNITEFGSSSVKFLVRFWLRDITLPRRNVTGDVLMNVWEKFHANGVKFPYPQQDLHFKTPLEIIQEQGKK